ncbi:MAG: SRPBCC family protein, partial [Myxococcota bacterium]
MSKSQSSHSIIVDVPIRKAYNQWTQFETFPQFMGGVERVRQMGPDRVHFLVNVAGRRVEYDAKIVEQEPDDRIVWRSVTGKKTGGMVTFRPVDHTRTEVTLDLMYEPEGVLENVGDLLGLV